MPPTFPAVTLYPTLFIHRSFLLEVLVALLLSQCQLHYYCPIYIYYLHTFPRKLLWQFCTILDSVVWASSHYN